MGCAIRNSVVHGYTKAQLLNLLLFESLITLATLILVAFIVRILGVGFTLGYGVRELQSRRRRRMRWKSAFR